jgi:hypothetical protein
MKKLLKILRNQAVDSTDQILINTLRKEAETERLKDRKNKEFENQLLSQVSSIRSITPRKQNRYFQPKWIFAFGCTVMLALFALLNPFPKFKLLFPGEREKLEKQMLVLNEIKETQEELEKSLNALAENLSQSFRLQDRIEWTGNFPAYHALSSLADIKNEFLQVSPMDILLEAQNTDFEFLYRQELNLIKETFLKKDQDT